MKIFDIYDKCDNLAENISVYIYTNDTDFFDKTNNWVPLSICGTKVPECLKDNAWYNRTLRTLSRKSIQKFRIIDKHNIAILINAKITAEGEMI